MSARIIAGIDPGLTGAIAWVTEDGRFHDMASLPVVTEAPRRRLIDVRKLDALLKRHPIAWAAIELVGALPRDGRSSAFSFGRAVGAVEAAISLHGIPFVRITPMQWKRWAGLPRAAQKSWSIAYCWRLCPDTNGRVMTSDQADAVLIALCAIEARRSLATK